MRVFAPTLLAIALALAACDKPAKEVTKAADPTPAPAVVAPSGFEHEPNFDAAGYYRPTSAAQTGNLKLAQIAIGAPSDFSTWEAGKREGLFGPIVLQFDDVTSPTVANELGANTHTVRLRLLPQSYRLYPGEVNFSAVDAKLGPVAFDGRFDQAAFAEAHKTGSSGDTPVMTGRLKIGDRVIEDLKFVFWAGD